MRRELTARSAVKELYDAAPSHAICGATYVLHAPSLRWSQPPALFLSEDAPATAPPAAAASPSAHDSLASRLVAPPRRCGHTAVLVASEGGGGGHVLMYGGHGADGAVCDDVWRLEV